MATTTRHHHAKRCRLQDHQDYGWLASAGALPGRQHTMVRLHNNEMGRKCVMLRTVHDGGLSSFEKDAPTSSHSTCLEQAVGMRDGVSP